jgi:hypothetical protein
MSADRGREIHERLLAEANRTRSGRKLAEQHPEALETTYLRMKADYQAAYEANRVEYPEAPPLLPPLPPPARDIAPRPAAKNGAATDDTRVRLIDESPQFAVPQQPLGSILAMTITLSDVEPEHVTWLWPGRLPAGKLVTLDGDPSMGKSTLSLTLAAHVSTGTRWPDDAICPMANVVILSAEDGLADTIRPRLDAAGGDPTRVHALTAVRTVTEEGAVTTRPPTLADLDVIEEVIRQSSAGLLIVDVLMAYLPGRVDSHRDQDVRAVLHRLAELAERTGCTILLLRHLNKTGGGNPMYRGGGSIGIVGAARAGFLLAADPDDPQLRVLAALKSNLAPTPDSLTFRLEPAPGSDVARVVWAGSSTHDAAALLRPAESDEDRDEHDEAAEWLIAHLSEQEGHEAPAGKVIGAAVKAGLAKRTVQRARKRAGVASRKAGMGGGWVWALSPEGATDPPEGAEGASSQRQAPSAPSMAPSGPGIVCAGCGERAQPPLVAGRCHRCAHPDEEINEEDQSS